MDEVLAVGDMAFQKKCLDKMYDVSHKSGRTILYVSHNMDTIRQLCERVILLDHGKIMFDGDVEEGISKYLGEKGELSKVNDLNKIRDGVQSDYFYFTEMRFLDKDYPVFKLNEPIRMSFNFSTTKQISDLYIRMIFKSASGVKAGMTTSEVIPSIGSGNHAVTMSLEHEALAPGKYYIRLVAFTSNRIAIGVALDVIDDAFCIETIEDIDSSVGWNTNLWGYTKLPDLTIEEQE